MPKTRPNVIYRCRCGHPSLNPDRCPSPRCEVEAEDRGYFEALKDLLSDEAVEAATAKIEAGEEERTRVLLSSLRPGESVGSIDRKPQTREALQAAIDSIKGEGHG